MTPSSGGLALEIVVPVFNEQLVLEKSITKLANYLSQEMPSTWQITIADNASTDNTRRIARAGGATTQCCTADSTSKDAASR